MREYRGQSQSANYSKKYMSEYEVTVIFTITVDI